VEKSNNALFEKDSKTEENLELIGKKRKDLEEEEKKVIVKEEVKV